MTEPLEVNLTSEQTKLFQEQGFLSIACITTDTELAWLRVVYDDIVRQTIGYTPAEMSRLIGRRLQEPLVRVMSPEGIVPELKNTICYKNARRIAARLLDNEEMNIASGWRIFFKPGHHSHETPWHQDAAHRPGPHHSVNIWIPLDAATPENGCMHFIAGSHHKGLRPHYLHEGHMKTDDVDPSQAVACPLPAGGATVHYCFTLHYAGPNQTDQPRRAFVIVCQGTKPNERIA